MKIMGSFGLVNLYLPQYEKYVVANVEISINRNPQISNGISNY